MARSVSELVRPLRTWWGDGVPNLPKSNRTRLTGAASCASTFHYQLTGAGTLEVPGFKARDVAWSKSNTSKASYVSSAHLVVAQIRWQSRGNTKGRSSIASLIARQRFFELHPRPYWEPSRHVYKIILLRGRDGVTSENSRWSSAKTGHAEETDTRVAQRLVWSWCTA